jgi:hypothetical protein
MAKGKCEWKSTPNWPTCSSKVSQEQWDKIFKTKRDEIDRADGLDNQYFSFADLPETMNVVDGTSQN